MAHYTNQKGLGRDPRPTAPEALPAEPQPIPDSSVLQAQELRSIMSAEGVTKRADQGVRGAGTQLPHLPTIQKAFGQHDVSGVKAHQDGPAREASAAIGAKAYAMGERIAFGANPGLHMAAHEAAHVVQQRQGVSLSGGVGRAGDAYERHADAVADRVVQGRSAEGLLGEVPSGAAAAPTESVQCRIVDDDGEYLSEDEVKERIPEMARDAWNEMLTVPGFNTLYRGAFEQETFTREGTPVRNFIADLLFSPQAVTLLRDWREAEATRRANRWDRKIGRFFKKLLKCLRPHTTEPEPVVEVEEEEGVTFVPMRGVETSTDEATTLKTSGFAGCVGIVLIGPANRRTLAHIYSGHLTNLSEWGQLSVFQGLASLANEAHIYHAPSYWNQDDANAKKFMKVLGLDWARTEWHGAPTVVQVEPDLTYTA